MKSLNYFQKKAFVLVVSLLLVIPNLCVYSLVGNYQRSSLAISINTNKKLFHTSFQNAKRIDAGMPATMVEAFLVATRAYFAEQGLGNSSTSGDHPLSFKTKNYAKYDFSGFDN